jgi:tryptophanyl-tRNA synthetase
MTTWKVGANNLVMSAQGKPADIQSKIAVSRNAADEQSITEADLKLGLLAYPVLQAADIALYRYAPPREI